MNKMIRNRERGSAMLVTLILIAALLAGVAVLVSLQLTSSKSTETTRTGMAALHCADAGLAASRIIVGESRTAVDTHLGAYPYSSSTTTWQTQPAFLTTYFATGTRNDIDGDGAVDFVIYIIDDDDDSNYGASNNNRVWLISRCTKYPDAPKEVRELIEFPLTGTNYKWQEGGAFGNNNAN